jgi:hypothetical protein
MPAFLVKAKKAYLQELENCNDNSLITDGRVDSFSRLGQEIGWARRSSAHPLHADSFGDPRA